MLISKKTNLRILTYNLYSLQISAQGIIFFNPKILKIYYFLNTLSFCLLIWVHECFFSFALQVLSNQQRGKPFVRKQRGQPLLEPSLYHYKNSQEKTKHHSSIFTNQRLATNAFAQSPRTPSSRDSWLIASTFHNSPILSTKLYCCLALHLDDVMWGCTHTSPNLYSCGPWDPL